MISGEGERAGGLGEGEIYYREKYEEKEIEKGSMEDREKKGLKHLVTMGTIKLSIFDDFYVFDDFQGHSPWV